MELKDGLAIDCIAGGCFTCAAGERAVWAHADSLPQVALASPDSARARSDDARPPERDK